MILFVDDEPERIASHVEELEFHGYFIVVATSVKELTRLFDEPGVPELVVRVMMPPGELENSQDGLRTGVLLLPEVRNRWPGVPVMALTNVSNPSTLDAAGRLGARVVQKRDVAPRQLPELVASIIRRVV